MNTDQLLSHLRTLAKFTGASLVTHGYLDGGTAEALTGLVLALVSWLLSHKTHAA